MPQPAAMTLPGEFKHAGTVDAADYVVWRKGLGTTYTQNDYAVWRAHFAASLGAGSGARATGFASASVESLSAAVPEPSGFLFATSVLGLLAFARQSFRANA